jgi:AcrR family transcriptional regulator
VPKLWNDTIEAHRAAVRDATLDATAALVRKHGLRGVTMSQIAEETGIGRATLYKYFPDVESILIAWHERLIAGHLAQLAELRDQPGDTGERLQTVLEAYAFMRYEGHGTELAAVLHHGSHLAHAEQHLRELVGGVIASGAQAGELRDDVPADELVTYCMHALSAASELRGKPAVRRLVEVTIAGLRRPRGRRR